MYKILMLCLAFCMLSNMSFGQIVFTESFDGTTTPIGWQNTSVTGGPWVFTGTPGYDVSSMTDHTGNGGNFAWIDFSGTDDSVILVTPTIDVSSLTTPALRFFEESHYTGALTPFNFLHVEAWNGSAWVNVITLQGNTPFGWDEYLFNVTAFTFGAGDSLKLRFHAESGGASGDFNNDILIDDVVVMEMPSCPNPTFVVANNVMGFSADLAWTEPGSATNWEIEWGAQGFAQGSGTQVFTSSNPHNLSGLSATTNYSFYVRSICGVGDTSLWVGPINFTTTVSCPAATALNTTNVTGTSADLGWTENGSATNWEIEWGMQGFAQGSGTQIFTSVNPHSLTGLTANTSYGFYVRSICGVGDTSTWSGPFNFTTPCAAFSPVYSEDFTTYLDACWSEAQGVLSPSVTLTGTTSNWVSDGFGNVGTTGSAKMNLWSTGRDEWLISPSIDLGSGPAQYQLEFDIALTDFGNTAATTLGVDDTIAVVISTDNGATWELANVLQAWLPGSEPSNTGDHIVINLASYTGIVKFGFYTASSISNADNDVFVDNFLVTNLASCAATSVLTTANLLATSVDLGWTENGTATSWEIEYGIAGFAQGTGTSVVTGTNPYNLTGLTSNTSYDFYVRAICAVGDTSAWSNAFNFMTPCSTFTLPWSEGFDNSGAIPSCWSMAGGENWLFNLTGPNHVGTNGTLSGSSVSNTYYATVDASGSEAPATLTSPYIDISSLTTPQVSFYEISDNEGFSNSILGVEVWDGAAWNVVGTYNTNTIGWEKKEIVLSALTFTGPAAVRFTFSETVASDFYDDIAIDDVTFEEAPAPPSDVSTVSFYNLDSIYCNAGSITASVIITNMTTNTETNLPYVITANGTPIGGGTIATLGPNASDTITVGPIPATTGVANIMAWTELVGDVDLANDTISMMVSVSNTLASASVTVAIMCNGDSTGEVRALGANGLATLYDYQWDAVAGNAITSVVPNLAAGSYAVTVTDSIGCADSTMVMLTEPTMLSATGTPVDAMCNGDSTGMSTITPAGGTATYGFMWDTGDSTATANNLGAGTYQVTVTDANGCMTTVSTTIGEPTVLTASVVDNGGGSATATATGGTTAYSFLWDNGQTVANATGLPGGANSCVTITDASGCTDTACVFLVLGVNDLASGKNISIYPNPTFGNAYAQVEFTNSTDIQIDMMDVAGRIVNSNVYTNVKSDRFELLTSELPSGIYLVKFTMQDEVYTQRLIIQRK